MTHYFDNNGGWIKYLRKYSAMYSIFKCIQWLIHNILVFDIHVYHSTVASYQYLLTIFISLLSRETQFKQRNALVFALKIIGKNQWISGLTQILDKNNKVSSVGPAIGSDCRRSTNIYATQHLFITTSMSIGSHDWNARAMSLMSRYFSEILANNGRGWSPMAVRTVR